MDVQEIHEFITEYGSVTMPFLIQNFVYLGVEAYEIEDAVKKLETNGLIDKTPLGLIRISNQSTPSKAEH